MNESPHTPTPELESIERLLERFERRLRLQQTVSGIVEGACLGLMIAGVAIAAIRTGWADGSLWWVWGLGALAIMVLGAVIRGLQSIDTVAAAQQLDKTHDLHDRLSTAVSLAYQDDRSRQDEAFVRAQLRDALRHIDGVDPRHAAPWRRPPDMLLLALVGMAVLTVGIIPIDDHEQPLAEPFEVRHGPVLDDATLALERSRLEEFRRHLEELPDDEAEALADEIEALLDAVEAREISDREFAKRVEELLSHELAAEMQEQRELDTLADALADAARQTSEEFDETLAENPELQQAMEALQNDDFEGASEALSELAERIERGDMDPEESSRMADVLERFSEHLDGHEDRLQDLFEEHRDAFEDLADQFDGGDFEGNEQLLEDAREAMEQAAQDRQDFDESSAKRQLDRLSRELEETAQQLRDDSESQQQQSPQQQSQQEESQQPDDAPDGEPDQGQDEQQAQDGPPDVVDEQEAAQQAQPEQPRGDDDEPDYRNEIGRQLDDASQQLEEMERQRQRQEQRRQAREQLEDMRESMSRRDDRESDNRREQMEEFIDRASGDQGQADDDGPQAPTGLGDDREDGHDPGDIDAEGTEFGESAGEGGPDDEVGPGGGDEEQEFGYQEEQLEGVDSQEGASRSEVIQAASEEGFATTEYQDVYADYEEIAEQVMDREEVPDGYRYYIERYFQLIRPQR